MSDRRHRMVAEEGIELLRYLNTASPLDVRKVSDLPMVGF